MAEDMSWKSRGLKYVNQRVAGTEGRQSWKDWGKEKINLVRTNSVDGTANISEERIALFPGWCTRRYLKPNGIDMDGAFTIDLYVNGYATSHRSPEQASRSQRTFMRLAKAFAALPKLAADTIDPDGNSMSKSTEDLLKTVNLPPRPDEITKDFEIEALEKQFQKANRPEDDVDSFTSPSSSSLKSNIEDDNSIISSEAPMSSLGADLRKLHANLDSRLRPFWSSVLPNRTVKLHVFATHNAAQEYLHSSGSSTRSPSSEKLNSPVHSQTVSTSEDGSFHSLFRLSWERLCQHPEALHIAFGDADMGEGKEHDLYVLAELMPAPPNPRAQAAGGPNSLPYEARRPKGPVASPSDTSAPSRLQFSPVAHDIQTVPLTFSSLRVVSDIDDTVKGSNVTAGARTVFHNVFVKELHESIIPGMGEWYTDLWKRGLRFHYVSNGPFELLPVIREFFLISGLPPGSIKLRSYAGRSLFSGLLSAPASRKRAGVLEIMSSFPDSRFVLIGDSGEQDLELYSEIAKDRPEQTRGVFIRDVESDTGMYDPIMDPTGWSSFTSGSYPTTSRPSTPLLPSLSKPRSTAKASQTDTSTPQRSHSEASSDKSRPGTPTGGSSSYPKQSDLGYFSSHLSAEPEPLRTPYNTEQPTPREMLTPKSAIPPRSFSTPVNDSSAPLASAVSYASSTQSAISTSSGRSARRQMTEAESKRNELQARVWRARTIMPSHIPLRVFRRPYECEEMESILTDNKT